MEKKIMTTQYKRSMVVSLIGRPNVGKSTIFNRLMKKAHKAITFDKPGVTRDRHYGIMTIEALGSSPEVDAILVDTGGFYPDRIEENVPKKRDQVMNKFFNIMTEQAKIAIKESDLILFVVDSREGLLPFDQTIADYIRAQKKEFWLVVNKYDSDKQEGEEFEFYGLGIDEHQLFKTSAEHGLGLFELKKALQENILEFERNQANEMSQLSKGITPREKVVARLALIGAPNAGKSTLLNHLLGSERALVSEIPGTTVDPIEGFFDIFFGTESKILGTDISFMKDDNLLFQQYEEFRQNNSDLYRSLSVAYNLEEEGTKGNPIYDEEDYLSEETPLIEEELFDDDQDDAIFDDFLEASDENLESEQEELDNNLYETVFAHDDENYEEELLAVEDEAVETDLTIEDNEAATGSFWRSLHIVDTAGIRRQKSIEGFIEQQSVYRSLRSITESDIVIIMVDATVGIAHQDRRLIDIALEKGKSVIVCLNKMDLMKERLPDEKARKEWLMDLRGKIPWLYYCDIITISAKYGSHIGRLKDAIKKTVLIRNTSISTGKLNRYVYELVEGNPVAIKNSKGKRFKVKYASMVKTSPPTFLFFTNLSKGIPDNYKNYLKNGLRKEFDLSNTPIHLIFRTGEDLSRRLQKRMKEIE
jgi:GTP-binding protein